MVKGSAFFSKKGKGLAPLVDRLKDLTKKEVYVGIPAEKSSRPSEGESINNAELLYIHTHGVRKKQMQKAMNAMQQKGMKYSAAHSLFLQTHGSPLWAIPPRPVLEPAIKANKAAIGKHLAAAATAAMNRSVAGAEREMKLAGMTAQNAARGWFENPANNWPPNSPNTIKRKGSDSPLIDTGEMRKAITYVIREKDSHD